MVKTQEPIIFKTPFARVAAALWSVAVMLVVLLLFLLPGKSPTAAESAQPEQASAAPPAQLADSSPMLKASVHATAKDKLD
ncbi:MAG TPA: hypothetical protein VHQ87_05525 [Rhizobacter sp.]|nr:hypothetical protein [Rhizobacter sp.]